METWILSAFPNGGVVGPSVEEAKDEGAALKEKGPAKLLSLE